MKKACHAFMAMNEEEEEARRTLFPGGTVFLGLKVLSWFLHSHNNTIPASGATKREICQSERVILIC